MGRPDLPALPQAAGRWGCRGGRDAGGLRAPDAARRPAVGGGRLPALDLPGGHQLLPERAARRRAARGPGAGGVHARRRRAGERRRPARRARAERAVAATVRRGDARDSGAVAGGRPGPGRGGRGDGRFAQDGRQEARPLRRELATVLEDRRGRRMTVHPSDYALDRGGPEIEGHVAACAACQERRAAAARLDERFARGVLPRTPRRVRPGVHEASSPRRRWWLIGGSFGAVAAAAALILVVRAQHPAEPAWDGVRGAHVQGDPRPLSVYVKRGDKVRVLELGQPLRAGDAVRFVARLDRPRFVELRARDAEGREHTLFPEGPTAVQLRPGEALPGGFVVDAAPGPERLTVLLGDRPFPVGRAPSGDTDVVRIELPKEP